MPILGRAAVALAAALLAAFTPGCARDAVPPGGVRVTGRLVDAESGEPVSRRTFWIHGFSEATQTPAQESLRPADGPNFSLTLPARNVRLRVADRSGTYELWEQRYTAAGTLDVEVRLVPTNWIRLHGSVLWRDGAKLRPLREGGASLRKARVSVGPHELQPDQAGSYSARVSRELHRVLTVNSSYGATPKELDLRGSTEGERSVDFVLGP